MTKGERDILMDHAESIKRDMLSIAENPSTSSRNEIAARRVAQQVDDMLAWANGRIRASKEVAG